jgi:hypothetical protein
VNAKIRLQRSRTRGDTYEYLLTGLVGCEHCGDRYLGISRKRRLVRGGKNVDEVIPHYVCGGTLRAKDRCRRVEVPRKLFEGAVLKIVEQEVLRPEALALLEMKLHEEVARRRANSATDDLTALEEREREFAARVSDGARLPDPRLH